MGYTNQIQTSYFWDFYFKACDRNVDQTHIATVKNRQISRSFLFYQFILKVSDILKITDQKIQEINAFYVNVPLKALKAEEAF